MRGLRPCTRSVITEGAVNSTLTSNIAWRQSRLAIHEARSNRATPGKRGMMWQEGT